MEPDNQERPGKEQQARERGKAIPFYARKVTQELARKKRPRKITPSKRAD